MKLARGGTTFTQHSVTNISYFVADTKYFSTSLRLVEKSLADTHKKIQVGMAEQCTKLTPDDFCY